MIGLMAADPMMSVYTVAKLLRMDAADVLARAKRREVTNPKPKRDGQAARTRRYRQRQRADTMVLTVEVHRIPFTEALISAARISEPDSLFRIKIEEATTQLLRDWSESWPTKV
jgi:hypothetical protein